MLISTEEKIAREWEKYKGFTVRPLPSTIEYYKKNIQTPSSYDNYLVYGGTPEVRTLFQNLDRHVCLVDKSQEMVRAMGRLTQNKIPLSNNEEFISVNWLEMSAIKKSFDMLIGDDAINMVDWKFFDIFLSNAANLLNKNGLFLCHLLVKPEDKLIQKTFEQVMMEFNQGVINNHYDFASRLNYICFDEKDYSMSWQQTINTIGQDNLNQLISKFDFINTFGLCNSKFYCPPQDKFECVVKKYFTIEEIYYPHEYEYCAFEPIYLLKKLG